MFEFDCDVDVLLFVVVEVLLCFYLGGYFVVDLVCVGVVNGVLVSDL